MTTRRHHRLSTLMDDRRLELGLSWKDVAAAAGIAEVTLRAVRAGTNNPSALTRRGIERALRWTAGSVEAILDGGAPEPVERQPPIQESLDRSHAALDRLQRRLEDADDRAREAVGELLDADERAQEAALAMLRTLRQGGGSQ